MYNKNKIIAGGVVGASFCVLGIVGFLSLGGNKSKSLDATTQSVSEGIVMNEGMVCVKYKNNQNILYDNFDSKKDSREIYNDEASKRSEYQAMIDVVSMSEVKEIIRPLALYKNFTKGTNLYQIQADKESVVEIISLLSKDPNVEFVESCEYSVKEFTTDGQEMASQRHLFGPTNNPGGINAVGAWTIVEQNNIGHSLVDIVVADTGVDGSHEDIDDVVGGGAGSHGTHVGGIIGATTDNGLGVAGVLGTNTKVMYNTRGCFIQGAAGILGGPGVVNMSCGINFMGQSYLLAAEAIVENGGVIIAAAGNSNTLPENTDYKYPCDQKYYTASGKQIFHCVGSTTEGNSKSDTSNYGDSLVFSAPGDNILSTCVGGGYCNKSGTSMASPVVAGSVAYLMGLGASAEQAIQELVNTAVSINTSVNMGAGRIDLCAATASFLGVSSSACNEVYPVCGNGVIEGNESCNDGNSSNGDGCTSECMIENGGVCESDLGCVSGNCEEVIVELCVSGDYGEKIACEGFSTQVSCLGFKQNVGTNGELLSVCQWESQAVMMCMPTCGNSIVEEGEYCDDGNSNEWDGCSSICTETCIYGEKPMNGIIVNGGKGGEVLPVNKVTCRCGDGIINGGEECDGSDLKKGIHCTAECKIQKVDEWPQLPIPGEGRGER